MKTTPCRKLPAIAGRLLWLICPAQFREHLLGDLEEAYVALQEERGAAKARAWYWRECLHSLPFFLIHRVANVKWRALFWSALTGAAAAIGASLGFFWILKSVFGETPPPILAHWILPLACSLGCAAVGGFAATLVHGAQNRVVLWLVAIVILSPKIAYVVTFGQGIAPLAASMCLVYAGILAGARMPRVVKLSR